MKKQRSAAEGKANGCASGFYKTQRNKETKDYS